MVKENQRFFNGLFVALDALICVLSMAVAYWLRFFILQGQQGSLELLYYLRLMVLIVPFYLLLYHQRDLYGSHRAKSLLSEVDRIVRANLSGLLFVFVLVFFLREVNVSRLTIFLFALVNIILTSLERMGLRTFLRRLRSQGYNLRHLLLVGWTDATGEFFDRVVSNKNLGYKVFGYLSQQEADLDGRQLTHQGSFGDLSRLLKSGKVDEVVIALEDDEFPYLGDIIEVCEKEGIKSSLLPFYTKYLPTRPVIDEVEGIPLINIRRVPLDNLLNSFIKRGFDIFCSLAALILLSPVMLLTAIGVKLSSPGPVIYRQKRIGMHKREFTMLKFRSMAVEGNDDMTTWGVKKDPRRTWFGTFIRKFSLDELPQLVNVLRGDMSLVGPRPERPYFVEKFREEVPLYMMKHLVRPGITGWAQVNGWRGDTSIVERIKCDIHYIENWSLLLDIKILFMTVFRGMFNSSEEL